MRPLIILFLLLAPAFGFTADAGVVSSAPPSNSVIVSAVPIVTSEPASAAVAPVVASLPAAIEGIPVREALDLYKKSLTAWRGPTVFGIASALAALVALLVVLLRRFGQRLMSQSAVNKFGIALAAVASGLALVTPGMEWWQAAFIGGAPLIATLSHGPQN